MALYKLFVPSQAVGADLVYFDLFNAGSTGQDVALVSVQPIVSGASAVVGTVGIDVFLTRTTAVGTGGTQATISGTSLTAATISAWDSNQPIWNALGITARLTPTGGATAGAVLGWRSLFGEETNSATYTAAPEMVRSPLPIFAGTGIRVVQGAVASAGAVGFDVMFSLKAR